MKTQCNNCGSQFIVAEEYTGKTVKCKKCQKLFHITKVDENQPLNKENKDILKEEGIKKENITSIQEKSEKNAVSDSNKKNKERKSKTKIIGFIIGVILIAIFLSQMLSSHPLKNKTAGEIKKIVDAWTFARNPEQEYAIKAGKEPTSVELFNKLFGKPKKKQLIDGYYYFYYDCKDGLVSLKIHQYGYDQQKRVYIDDISVY